MTTATDEIVEVGIYTGKRTVSLEMTLGELKEKSPKRILRDALNNPEIRGKDRKELALCKSSIDRGGEPLVLTHNVNGDIKVLPYTDTDVTEYVRSNGHPFINLVYSARYSDSFM